MEKIIEALSKKYSLPKFIISEIVESQFKFTREAIETGNLNNIRLIDLGIFHVPVHKLERSKEHIKNRGTLSPEFLAENKLVRESRRQAMQKSGNEHLTKRLKELAEGLEAIKTRF